METRDSPFSFIKKTKRKDSPFSNTEDRISNLPDTLIHHIFSSLDMKYVVKTSILSRRWRYIWTSLPTLNFNSLQFAGLNKHFLVFVERALMFRDNSDMQRLDFIFGGSFKVNYDVTSNFNTWILAAVKCNVQELAVNVICITVHKIFQFPLCLFTSKSLTKLELRLCNKDRSEVILPSSMCLPRLKYLGLYGLTIKDDKLADKLFSSCPVLESLIIKRCNVNLNISSLTLRQFEFENLEDYLSDSVVKTVKLCAPNLTSFTCRSYMSQDYSLNNLSSLVAAKIKMVQDQDFEETPSELSAEENETYAQYIMKLLRAFHNVKDLTLPPWFLEVLSGTPDVLDSETAAFGNLRSLKLQTKLSRDCFRVIAYLLKISPHLESLTLVITEKFDDDKNANANESDSDYDNTNGEDKDDGDDDDDDKDEGNDDDYDVVDDNDEDEGINNEYYEDDYNKYEDKEDCPIYSFCDEIQFHSTIMGDYLEAQLPLPCMLSHLKLVDIRGLVGCVSELVFLEIVLNNAMVLEKVILDSCTCERHNRKFCSQYCKRFSRHTERRMSKFVKKLQTLPRASSIVEILVL